MKKITKYKIIILITFFILLVAVIASIFVISKSIFKTNTRPKSDSISPVSYLLSQEKKLYYLNGFTEELIVVGLESNVEKIIDKGSCTRRIKNLINTNDKLYFVSCESQSFFLKSINSGGSVVTEKVAQIPNNSQISEIYNASLSPDASYAVITLLETRKEMNTSPGHAYIVDWATGNLTEILSFSASHASIGGRMCSEIKFSPDSEFFILCQSDGVSVLDINHQPYVFNRQGMLIKEIPRGSDEYRGKDEFHFIDNENFIFQDLDGIYKGSISSNAFTLITNIYGTSEISTDKKYLKTYKHIPNTLSYNLDDPIFINTLTGEILEERPGNLVFLSDYSKLEANYYTIWVDSL